MFATGCPHLDHGDGHHGGPAPRRHHHHDPLEVWLLRAKTSLRQQLIHHISTDTKSILYMHVRSEYTSFCPKPKVSFEGASPQNYQFKKKNLHSENVLIFSE